MFRASKAFLLLAFIVLALPLAGCESVDSALHSIKESFSSRPAAPPPRQDAVVLADKPASAMTASPQGFGSGMIITSGQNCPKVAVVENLNSLHQFANPERPTPESRISSIVIRELRASCAQNETNLVIDLDLTFEGKLGPKAKVWETDRPSFAYPYFIAITTTNGNIAAKEIFAATVSYDRTSDTTIHRESMRHIIPLAGDYGAGYEILAGFQLTEGELAYNRSLGNGSAGFSSGLPEQYISSGEPAMEEPATAKPMTVIPEQKPPVPETAKAEPAPAPEPEPAPEPAPAPAPAPAAEPATPETGAVMEEQPSLVEEPAAEPSPAPQPETAPEGMSAPESEPAMPGEEAATGDGDSAPATIDLTEP